MRITNSMMVNTLMTNLTRNMNRMSEYQDQLATGKRVIRASDDPVGTSKILKYKSDIAALEQYEKNTGDSLAWLEVTESSISDTGDVLQRMRELAVQGANGTNSAEETQKIAMEIKQIKEHLINNGNFSYAGRYAFSGYQTDKPLFNPDGTYQIDITQVDIDNKPQLQYQVSIGQDMDVTTNGLDVFGYVPKTDIMATRFPDAAAVGTADTQAALSTTFDFTADFTAGANDDATVTITVDGTGFTIAAADLTALDGSGTPITKTQVMNLLNGAENGGIKLSTMADVYIDQNNNLVLRSKSFGGASSLQFGYTGDSGGGLTAADLEAAFGVPAGVPVAGTNVGNATVAALAPGQDIPSGDIAANIADIENKRFYVTLNGDRKAVTIGAVALPRGQTELAAALNASLDTAFGAGNVVASFAGDSLTFTTAVQPSNGQPPQLEIRPIKATESQLMADIDAFVAGLESGDTATISAFISKVDGHLNQILSVRADIGSRVNRMELVVNRISDNIISYTTMLSDVQDADMAGVIMYLKNAENVYKAALSTGSKVIQPSLLDYLR